MEGDPYSTAPSGFGLSFPLKQSSFLERHVYVWEGGREGLTVAGRESLITD